MLSTKTNLEITEYHEKFFLGLSLRQLACFCLLSQICFVFDNSNLQHIRTFPMGFAFFLFCHHSTKCD